MKIYIIAGEASGDIYGAKLINSLKAKSDEKTEFFGIGGERMIKTGFSSLFEMSELSIMGFAEILPHIRKLKQRIRQTVENIKKINPDIVITIDSPGFCFRVAEQLQDSGIKLVHYVAPTVWAYKPQRAQKVANLYDHLLVILPFEPPYFDEVGLDNTFIGHPIFEQDNSKQLSQKEFRDKYNISSKAKVICVMPGSRKTEINRMLPVFGKAIEIIKKTNPNLHVIIPTIGAVAKIVKDAVGKWPVTSTIIDNPVEKQSAFKASDAALVKSGTGSLEVAIAGTPMVIAYKLHPISHWLISRMVKIKYANLINHINNQEIIPELLQYRCTPELIAAKLNEVLNDKTVRKEQIEKSHTALKQMGLGQSPAPSEKAADKILEIFHSIRLDTSCCGHAQKDKAAP